ncbi:ABC transporter ATP-binding protein [uncultured Treponema sp.]|uniref:ABC transporter ATP-binding protein n=1 Tax=uncultured Treponema sp. TaxID=162155 RepID=UPI0025D63D50|nr:ABC transporter ATP-binding protein [uncultured Treponema sp.]
MTLVKKITLGMEKRYWLCTATSPLFMLGEVIMETSIPLVMARLVDIGIKNSDSGYVIRHGLLMILMASFSLFCGSMCGRISSIAAFGFSKNLRQKLFSKVLSFSFSDMDKFGTDTLVTRLTSDVTNLQNMYQNIIRTAVRSPVMLVFGTIMAFSINSKLALIFFIVIPVLAAILIAIVICVYPRFQAMLKKYDMLNRVVQENLIAIRVVKSFVRGEHENAKFDQIADDLQKTQMGAEKIVILNLPVMHLMIYACLTSALWFGGNMVITSRMLPGQLISFLSYITQILMSLMMLSRLFVMFILSRTSLSRIMEVLSLGDSQKIQNKEGKAFPYASSKESATLSPKVETLISPSVEEACSSVPDIEFSHVTFSYDGRLEHAVLTDINLLIPKGSTVGILGGTGSSKSTLVHLIPALYEATQGSVLVGGKDVRDWDLTALRQKIGFVLQKNVLFSGTIAENLRWGNENASDEDLIEACRAADADSFISSFPSGYQTDLSQGGINLSGGQKQRLCIARALVKKPEIMILDDSTSAVDSATERRIRTALRTCLPATTKIIIAQRIASVQDADFIVVLEGGKINGKGTHNELMKNNTIYREVYESQMSEN